LSRFDLVNRLLGGCQLGFISENSFFQKCQAIRKTARFLFAYLRTRPRVHSVSKIKVIFYKDNDSSVPVLDWLEELPSKAVAKCLVRIERLSELGHELRRPEADFLRDKIYELRIGLRGINYRILYFFHGDVAAVLAHGIVKENAVPPKEIERAIERRKRFETHPEKHTHTEEPQYETEIEND